MARNNAELKVEGPFRKASRNRTFVPDRRTGNTEYPRYYRLAAEYGYQSAVLQLRRQLAYYAADANGLDTVDFKNGKY